MSHPTHRLRAGPEDHRSGPPHPVGGGRHPRAAHGFPCGHASRVAQSDSRFLSSDCQSCDVSHFSVSVLLIPWHEVDLERNLVEIVRSTLIAKFVLLALAAPTIVAAIRPALLLASAGAFAALIILAVAQ